MLQSLCLSPFQYKVLLNQNYSYHDGPVLALGGALVILLFPDPLGGAGRENLAVFKLFFGCNSSWKNSAVNSLPESTST